VAIAESIVPSVLASGQSSERVRVIPNGIDVDDIRQKAGLAGREAPLTVSLVVGSGRLATVKGFDLLLRAHAIVRSRGVEHRLRIMGEGPERAELEALIEELDIASSVELLGFVKNPYPQLARADLFVLSSRLEGMPLTVLEALALGVPIIATECSSGVTELLGPSTFGDLVPTESAQALADAIERHLRTPHRLRAKAEFGPNHARGFAIDTSARQYLDVFGQVLAHERGGDSAETQFRALSA
jgi:glycosyltransferase involved in cell wall biosynthesis